MASSVGMNRAERKIALAKILKQFGRTNGPARDDLHDNLVDHSHDEAQRDAQDKIRNSDFYRLQELLRLLNNAPRQLECAELNTIRRKIIDLMGDLSDR